MTSFSTDETVLPHSKELNFAGASCDLHTNSCELLSLLSNISIPTNPILTSRFSMRVLVNESSPKPMGEPHFRGLHHVVTASFGSDNIFVFDILRRTVNASISTVAARNSRFWKEKLVPISLGVLGAAMGMVPMHCACLESDGDGLLIAGLSGAGKSTLSVALSQEGFSYVSDDWTYISQFRSSLVAHGTSAPVKLLPDAVSHFPGLTRYKLQTSMNGELAYEINIAETFGTRIERACEPRWLIFLERTRQSGAKFTTVTSCKAHSYLDSSMERLPVQLFEASAMRDLTVEAVSRLPCWLFRYGGTPRFAARHLRAFVANRREKVLV
ncbi:hypothetical protein [Tunturiibacter gelidiferens]|uniref:Uncharacterized protein n=1 Tax=Tunturiibacter gelidiferens TaxID=3069689 RepID=A0AAU7YXT2_9BACT